MNQAKIENVVSKLRYKVAAKARRLSNPDGPEGRMRKIQKTLTALVKYERIELNYYRADETRGYAERLISEALRYGPEHKPTMELADFWLMEKQLVHKLFKVLVPRFQDYTVSYTALHKAPKTYPGNTYDRAVLELRGNIYPGIEHHNPFQHNLLHNVLLNAARKDTRMQKYNEVAEDIGTSIERTQ